MPRHLPSQPLQAELANMRRLQIGWHIFAELLAPRQHFKNHVNMIALKIRATTLEEINNYWAVPEACAKVAKHTPSNQHVYPQYTTTPSHAKSQEIRLKADLTHSPKILSGFSLCSPSLINLCPLSGPA
ncbi:hypothetical protein PAAG_05843 [Paracoccidioides lutzii Pb01]|uniref:Uncharacterized protein n=1 Tax=Paracoccidioides lutzii (strain ATCC MYA-826 / Pb01) TaxID=502779 RepID=C1H502_PARBA|nr:hypothetical protein PAAG_05843 [Paracoccidioides lutzii Pb01]EEH34796.2 hypothetical protein PAAG_05843 [Paracoccidioides lutzii Pb01]